MKIGILADIHAHPFSEFGRTVVAQIGGTEIPVNSRLWDQLITLWNVTVDMKGRGVTHLLINGDLFHVRGAVPTQALQLMYAVLQKIVKELKIKIAILVGNHDQEDKAGVIHAVYTLRDLCTVVDVPGPLSIGPLTIYCVPYISDKDTLQKELDRAKGDILFAHLGVDGAMVGPVEYRIKDPITVEDLGCDRFKWVFLGHYHKHQILAPNAMYVGSPYQINRGEMGENKVWVLYDAETDTVDTIETNAKEFRTVLANEFLSADDSLLKHYYDVLMEPGVDAEALMAKVHRHYAKVIPLKKTSVQDSRLEVEETQTDEQLLRAYIGHVHGESWVSERLLSLGLQLLNKSKGVAVNNTRLSFLRGIVENFMAIGKADLKAHRPGSVVAVIGDNQTTEGFTSNGAGKSCLLPESIVWCLWGETLRELPVDKIVNRKAKRNCRVTWVLMAGNKKLEVSRYRKHKKYGDSLRLIIDGRDVTEGTPRLTQARLNQELGVDMTTFTSVLAFSPDTLRFVKETDANQKHVLDSILQTRRFTAALEITKQALTVVKTKRLEASQSVETGKGALESLQALATEYALLNASWESREAERVSRLREDISIEGENRDNGEGALLSLRHKLMDAQTDISSHEQVKPDLEALDNAVTSAVASLAEVEAVIREKESQRDAIQKRLDAAVDMAGKPCETCGQKVTNTGKLIATYQAERNSLDRILKLQRNKRVQLNEAREAALTARKEARSWEADLRRLQNDERNLERSIIVRETQVDTCNTEIKRLKAQIADKPVNEYDTLIPKVKTSIEAAEETLAQAQKELRRQEIMLERLTFWQGGFGTAGIRSYLLDLILPSLTEYANAFSDKMSGGTLQIAFQTHKEGTATDRFSIQAWNEEGSDIYRGNSSGEKRRVDVCVMLALFRIAYSRTRFNILLLDEALDTLDVAGLENIVGLLEDLAKELKLTIFVTSHTDLNTRLFDCITLVKVNGVSTLVG